MDDILRSRCYDSPLRYDNVDCFAIEVIKIKLNLYFKNTKKDNIMTVKDEELYRNTNICRVCEKKY